MRSSCDLTINIFLSVFTILFDIMKLKMCFGAMDRKLNQHKKGRILFFFLSLFFILHLDYIRFFGV